MPRAYLPFFDLLTEADIARYWSYVDQSGGLDAEWPWTRALDAYGYGVFMTSARRQLKSHRVSLTLDLGRDITFGLDARHRCQGHRECCNPRHLYEGDNADDIRDMLAVGRHANQRKTAFACGCPIDEAHTFYELRADGSVRQRRCSEHRKGR
jgi:hypothetical protein